MARLAAILFLSGCAIGTTTTTARPDDVRSHVYPLPLDNVLAQAKPLLVQKGWRVQRSGNILFTNWLGGETGSLVGYRVFGERIDAGYCTIRVERLVATPSTLYFGQKKGGHQVDLTTSAFARSPAAIHNESRELSSAFEVLPEFQEDSANDSVATGVPSGMVVSQQERDKRLELELQEQIDPPVVAPVDPPAVAASADALADAGVSAAVNPVQRLADEPRLAGAGPLVAERRPTALAGIWDGTFTFRGSITGSFSGEVTIAVDGDSVDVDDFCPESGGTLNARGSSNSAAWQGKLACPAIPVKGCSSATFTYNFANATLNGTVLTVVAAGNVDTPMSCRDSGGALSVAFVAQKADYVHIAVTRVKRATVCAWPSDWEDLASSGSMAMPDPPTDDVAYLGIIRAKGSRLNEIQRLLRHCRQVVLLHGQPVLMRLAVTRPHHNEMQ